MERVYCIDYDRYTYQKLKYEDYDKNRYIYVVNVVAKTKNERMNKMFDVNNVKVGDFFQTVENRIGYVITVEKSGCGVIVEGRYIEDNCRIKWVGSAKEGELSRKFKQIGTYVFEDKIELLEYEDFAETRAYDQSCMCKIFHNVVTLSQEIRGGKDIYKIITYQEKAKVDKINEIIDWINNHERGDKNARCI